ARADTQRTRAVHDPLSGRPAGGCALLLQPHRRMDGRLARRERPRRLDAVLDAGSAAVHALHVSAARRRDADQDGTRAATGRADAAGQGHARCAPDLEERGWPRGRDAPAPHSLRTARRLAAPPAAPAGPAGARSVTLGFAKVGWHALSPRRAWGNSREP